LGKARQLADKVEGEVAAILLGHRVSELADKLIAYGADRVWLADDVELADYQVLPYTRVIANLIRRERPDIVLYTASTTGRELAPRIAARLGTGLTADCTDLDIGEWVDETGRCEHVLYQIRPAFGGDVMATIVTPRHRPQMATVRPGIFGVPEPDPARRGEVATCPVKLEPSDRAVEILKKVKEKRRIDLTKASIIVSGGRGAGPEGFDLIRRLAELLGGQVGASRAAVDAGWISYDHQVGLSGQTVKPDIYIACGISGTVQHLAGMRDSRVIIAINRDPQAQIFKFADYGIVGDLFQVIPELIKRLSG
jgi:electron transfer flavoprotein alpha subunit